MRFNLVERSWDASKALIMLNREQQLSNGGGLEANEWIARSDCAAQSRGLFHGVYFFVVVVSMLCVPSLLYGTPSGMLMDTLSNATVYSLGHISKRLRCTCVPSKIELSPESCLLMAARPERPQAMLFPSRLRGG